IMVQVGPVTTTHPEAGSSKHAAEPPPAPEKIQELLPKLADLPKEAEERAKTVADLQREVRALKGQLKQSVTVGAVVDTGERKKHAAQLKEFRSALDVAMKIMAKVTAVGFENTAIKAEEVHKALEAASAKIVQLAEQKIGARATEFDKLRREASAALEKMKRLIGDEQLEVAVTVKHQE